MERRDFFNAILGGWAGLGLLHSRRNFRIYPKVQAKKPEQTGVLVQVLGTAQDGGIPHIGCYCQNCLRAREDARFSRLWHETIDVVLICGSSFLGVGITDNEKVDVGVVPLVVRNDSLCFHVEIEDVVVRDEVVLVQIRMLVEVNKDETR